jgi:tellurite resistance protein
VRLSRAYAPAPFFGIPLGILGLGLAWRGAARLWALPLAISELVLAAGVAVWAVLIASYMAKWVFSAADAAAELYHPINCCFIGLAPATTSLVGLAALPYSRPLAISLFVAGAAGTLAFALFRTGRLWKGGRDPGTTTAVLYLPAVAGNFITAIAAGLLGWHEWGQLAFGAGAFSWLAIESVLLHRLYSQALPPPLRPTLGIQLAPPAVAALAYLSVSKGIPDVFAQALIGYALLQALLLLRLWRWIAEQPFAPSYWAFSFGASALAGAAIRMAIAGSRAEQVIAPAVFVAANLLVLTLAIKTVILLFSGNLLPPPAVPSLRPILEFRR